MRSLFQGLVRLIQCLVELLFEKPIRERGVLWTLMAWLLALNSIALTSQLIRANLIWAFLVWVLSLVFFLKVHTKPRRTTRPLPYRRRR